MSISLKNLALPERFQPVRNENDPYHVLQSIKYFVKKKRIQNIKDVELIINPPYNLYLVKDFLLPNSIDTDAFQTDGVTIRTKVVSIKEEYSIKFYCIVTHDLDKIKNKLVHVFIPNLYQPHVNHDFSYCIPVDLIEQPFTIERFLTLRESFKRWNLTRCYRVPPETDFTAKFIWEQP